MKSTQVASKEESVRNAVASAESVLHIWQKAWPKDDRPAKAIEAAKAWLANPSSETSQSAKHASTAAYAASYTAYAATSVAHAVYAASAARAAAYAAHAAAAFGVAYGSNHAVACRAYDAAVSAAAYAAHAASSGSTSGSKDCCG